MIPQILIRCELAAKVPRCAFFRVQLLVADAEPTEAVGFKDFCA